MLWKQNRQARPVGYLMNKAEKNSTWYSRSMGILGTLLLLFLIMHLAHFCGYQSSPLWRRPAT